MPAAHDDDINDERGVSTAGEYRTLMFDATNMKRAMGGLRC